MSASNRGTAAVSWIAAVLAGAALAVGITALVQQARNKVATRYHREALVQANQKIAVLEIACRAAASQEKVTASINEVRAETAAMNSALTACKEALGALVKQSEDLTASISAASDGIKACSTDIDSTKQQMVAVKSDVDSTKQQMAAVRNDVHKLTERFGSVSRDTRMLKTQVLLARETPVDLVAEAKAGAEQVAETTSAAQSLTEKLAVLAKRVGSFSGKLAALEQLQGQLAGKLKSLRDENAEFLEGVFYNVLWKEAGVEPAKRQ